MDKYDYDACFVYPMTFAPYRGFLEQMIDYFTQQQRIKLVDMAWEAAQPFPPALASLLERCSACVVIGGHDSPLYNELFREGLEKHHELSGLRLFALIGERGHRFDGVEIIWLPPEREPQKQQEHIDRLIATIVGQHLITLARQTLQLPTTLGTALFGAWTTIPDYIARPEEQAVYDFWQDSERHGVLALVGIGGSGKTSLVRRFLEALPTSSLAVAERVTEQQLNPPHGLFVWSFYVNPDIEDLIRKLWTFLSGETATKPARDTTYRIIRSLEHHTAPNLLLIFDGLEKVQTTHTSPAGVGALRDSSLRHLLRRIAQGDLPIKLLVTSRYPLTELTPQHSYWSIDTNQLGKAQARALLERRGLQLSQAEADTILSRFGQHALTLDLLARLLTTYHQGHIVALEQLAEPEGAYTEEQAYQLACVLAGLEKELTAQEQAVLHTIALVQKPLSLALLQRMFEDYAHTQIGTWHLQPQAITAIVEHLQNVHLIEVYESATVKISTAHQSIRDYIAHQARDITVDIHRKSRQLFQLALAPRYKIELQDLPLLEALIYHSLSMGDTQQALNWYSDLGYRQIAWNRGAYRTGLELTSMLSERLGDECIDPIQAMSHEHNLFLLELGYAALAESRTHDVLAYYRQLMQHNDREQLAAINHLFPLFIADPAADVYYDSVLVHTLVDAQMMQGKLQAALDNIEAVLTEEQLWERLNKPSGQNPYGRRALIHSLQGNTQQALADFKAADRFCIDHWSRSFFRSTSNWHHKPLHARFLARLGKLSAARQRLASLDEPAMREYRPLSSAYYDLAAADIAYFSGEHTTALGHIEQTLSWALQAGQQHVYTQALILLARQHLQARNHKSAAYHFNEALQNAQNYQFGLQEIDALLGLAYLARETQQLEHAASYAHTALQHSQHHGYAWGSGDASYVLATIQHMLGQNAPALSHAQQALKTRTQICDPRVTYVQRLISTIQAHS